MSRPSSGGSRSTGLTVIERRVADEAARGATSRDIATVLHLSHRSVESHLAAAYRKLGIGSRRELILRRDELGIGNEVH